MTHPKGGHDAGKRQHHEARDRAHKEGVTAAKTATHTHGNRNEPNARGGHHKEAAVGKAVLIGAKIGFGHCGEQVAWHLKRTGHADACELCKGKEYGGHAPDKRVTKAQRIGDELGEGDGAKCRGRYGLSCRAAQLAKPIEFQKRAAYEHATFEQDECIDGNACVPCSVTKPSNSEQSPARWMAKNVPTEINCLPKRLMRRVDKNRQPNTATASKAGAPPYSAMPVVRCAI